MSDHQGHIQAFVPVSLPQPWQLAGRLFSPEDISDDSVFIVVTPIEVPAARKVCLDVPWDVL
jgi:hypothetical protein